MTQQMVSRQERLRAAVKPLVKAGLSKRDVIEVCRASAKVMKPEAYGEDWNFVYEIIDQEFSFGATVGWAPEHKEEISDEIEKLSGR